MNLLLKLIVIFAAVFSFALLTVGWEQTIEKLVLGIMIVVIAWGLNATVLD